MRHPLTNSASAVDEADGAPYSCRMGAWPGRTRRSYLTPPLRLNIAMTGRSSFAENASGASARGTSTAADAEPAPATTSTIASRATRLEPGIEQCSKLIPRADSMRLYEGLNIALGIRDRPTSLRVRGALTLVPHPLEASESHSRPHFTNLGRRKPSRERHTESY